MNINVIDYIGDRATDMRQGDEIYKLVIEGFNQNEKVYIDFSNMTTILSTFLNNAIGTLYKDYTSEFLNENLKIVNLCQDDLYILKRVINRAKDFYTKPQIVKTVLDDNFAE